MNDPRRPRTHRTHGHRLVVLGLAMTGMAASVAGCAQSQAQDSGSDLPSISIRGLPSLPREALWWIAIQQRTTPTHVSVDVPGDVLFQTSSAELTGDAASAIQVVAQHAIAVKATALQVSCYTDNEPGPDPDFNRRLSVARSASAASALEAAGLPVALLAGHLSGQGDSSPVASNATPTGRSLNRRCSFVITIPPPS